MEITQEGYYDLYLDNLQDIKHSNVDILDVDMEILELNVREIECLENLSEGVAVCNQLLILLVMFFVVYGICGLIKLSTKWFGMFFR